MISKYFEHVINNLFNLLNLILYDNSILEWNCIMGIGYYYIMSNMQYHYMRACV